MRGLRGLVCMPRNLAVADKEVHTRDGERVEVRWLVFNCTGRPLFVNTISGNPKLFVEWKLIPEWDGPAPEVLPFGPLSGPVQLLRPEAWDFFRRLPPVDLAKPGGVDPCDGLLVETDVYVGRKPVMQRAHLRVSRMFVCYAEGSPERMVAVASRRIRVVYD